LRINPFDATPDTLAVLVDGGVELLPPPPPHAARVATTATPTAVFAHVQGCLRQVVNAISLKVGLKQLQQRLREATKCHCSHKGHSV
jgi:hypothetical protein